MGFSETLRNWFEHPVENAGQYKGPFFFLLFLTWIAIGTFFFGFAPKSDLGLIMGFFQAVNIGYSIGYGFPREDPDVYLLFSTLYVLIGSSFVAVALAFFAEKVTEDHDNWFTNIKRKQKLEEAMTKGITFYSIKRYILHHRALFRSLFFWIVFVVLLSVYSKYFVGWSFYDAQYFAISTLSTGGHWPIPEDSPKWLFGVTGLSAMVGVPLMAVAMAQTARSFIDQGDLDDVKMAIVAAVSAEELKMLEELGLEDGDGFIDRTEFIIMCMVRMGTDPRLIAFISDRFDELDQEKTGRLTIRDITEGQFVYTKRGIRKTQSYMQSVRRMRNNLNSAKPGVNAWMAKLVEFEMPKGSSEMSMSMQSLQSQRDSTSLSVNPGTQRGSSSGNPPSSQLFSSGSLGSQSGMSGSFRPVEESQELEVTKSSRRSATLPVVEETLDESLTTFDDDYL